MSGLCVTGGVQMGIQGLLPLLKPASKNIHISSLSGLTVAIDAYSWLHKAAYSCALDIFIHSQTAGCNLIILRLTEYCKSRIRMLQHYNIVPYLVFDGAQLPAKKNKEEARRKSREEARIKAELLISGKNMADAFLYAAKAIDVTPEMAHEVIQWLKEEGIRFVVAPYEADAQLAYLEKLKLVDAVITEDSDLLVFGCNRVIFKLDHQGNAQEVTKNSIFELKDFSFDGFSMSTFRDICIFSGCDYLDSIGGIGIKSSLKYVQIHKTIEKILENLKFNAKKTTIIPQNYLLDFEQARMSFLFQRVFDPLKNCLTTLNSFPEELEAPICIGQSIPVDIAIGIAEGRLHPESYQPFSPIPTKIKRNPIIPLQSSLDLFEKKIKRKEETEVSGPKFQRVPSISSEISSSPGDSLEVEIIPGQVSPYFKKNLVMPIQKENSQQETQTSTVLKELDPNTNHLRYKGQKFTFSKPMTTNIIKLEKNNEVKAQGQLSSDKTPFSEYLSQFKCISE